MGYGLVVPNVQTIPFVMFLSKCLSWPALGAFKFDVIIGIMVIDKKNTTMIFKEAIIPNSMSLSELVNTKVEKPKAVVKFVKKVALPIL